MIAQLFSIIMLWSWTFLMEDDSGKRHEKCQQLVQNQNTTMEKSWVIMMHLTDKEHNE